MADVRVDRPFVVQKIVVHRHLQQLKPAVYDARFGRERQEQLKLGRREREFVAVLPDLAIGLGYKQPSPL